MRHIYISILILSHCLAALAGGMLIEGRVMQQDVRDHTEAAKLNPPMWDAGKEKAAWAIRDAWLQSTDPAEKAELCAGLVRIAEGYAGSPSPELVLVLPDKSYCAIRHPNEGDDE